MAEPSERWVEIPAHPIEDADGNLFAGCLVVAIPLFVFWGLVAFGVYCWFFN
jgi:hypothetical protein